jgi:hypothetical protein
VFFHPSLPPSVAHYISSWLHMQVFHMLKHLSVTLANNFTWNIKVEMLLVCFDIWSVVDRSEVYLGPNDPAIQLTW